MELDPIDEHINAKHIPTYNHPPKGILVLIGHATKAVLAVDVLSIEAMQDALRLWLTVNLMHWVNVY